MTEAGLEGGCCDVVVDVPAVELDGEGGTELRER
jgi:hypothetical protein